MSEGVSVRFGECAYCGESLERPFWDTVCFDCQDDRNAELAADDEALDCDEDAT
jgi:hypothetical protein